MTRHPCTQLLIVALATLQLVLGPALAAAGCGTELAGHDRSCCCAPPVELAETSGCCGAETDEAPAPESHDDEAPAAPCDCSVGNAPAPVSPEPPTTPTRSAFDGALAAPPLASYAIERIAPVATLKGSTAEARSGPLRFLLFGVFRI